MNYYIKYGNRLYLKGPTTLALAHDIRDAFIFYTAEEANSTLAYFKQDTGLYEARVVAESDIAIVVDDVP